MIKAGTSGAERSRARRGRGAAMVEFVLAIPFLATLIGLTFFLGWAVRHQQDVIISARYAAWQEVLRGTTLLHSDLNEMFFANKAARATVGVGKGPDSTRRELVDEVGATSAWAHALADEALFGAKPFPAGRSALVRASFPTDVALWRYFEGSIGKTHARDGRCWRRGQAGVAQALRLRFLIELDQRLLGVRLEGSELAARIRELYLDEW